MAEVKKSNSKPESIKSREITQEMKESYIDYAMSVIVSRALPDVRDGLKPVQRRILYAMHEMGLRHDAKFRKSATITGGVLGKYHPHGDMPVYGAVVRMAQDFSLRYPLIKGQGNFGSIDGDPPAHMRYTECKLSKIGEETLKDIEKNTVDFVPNFDGTTKEPVVLPSPLPNLLLNGSLGIAVGMATNIPPHNLSEICDALIYFIEHEKATTEDLFQWIAGPDFPTGGLIYNKESILAAYSQGRGPIVIRGKAEILETKMGLRIIISEIPFGVQKSALIQQIAKLVQDKKLIDIKDIRDESDREGMRVVIDLKKGVSPKRILNFLYKATSLQTSFHLNMLALVDGIQPKVLSLPEILEHYLAHRKQVIFRRTKFDLEKAKEKEHILEGLNKALENIDAVIKTIKSSKNREEAQQNLIKKFKLTEIQANAILEMKLSALARLEREKIEAQLKETKILIKELTLILKSPVRIKEIIKGELKSYKETFGDKRKTRVFAQEVEEISNEDLVPQEPTVITLTQAGFIKRIQPSTLRVQKRGGKGVSGQKTTGEDIVEHLIFANTHDELLFFTDSGKVFKTRAYEIPEAARIARGRSLLNFLEISSEEKVLDVIPLPKKGTQMGYLVMVTKNGIIKRTEISVFENVRRTGLIAISLRPGDLLKKVLKSSGGDEIILVTKKGKCIRFGEKDIRQMGRSAAGVRGIRLGKEDEVVGMEIVNPEDEKSKAKNGRTLLIVTENGYGKRTNVSEYKNQRRGGMGVKTVRITQKTGNLMASRILKGSEKYLVSISQKGQVIKVEASSISKMGRDTQGVRIMRLGEQDKVASITCI